MRWGLTVAAVEGVGDEWRSGDDGVEEAKAHIITQPCEFWSLILRARKIGQAKEKRSKKKNITNDLFATLMES